MRERMAHSAITENRDGLHGSRESWYVIAIKMGAMRG